MYNLKQKLMLTRELWMLLFLALVVRVFGIWYGLPLPINVDEPSLVSSVLALKGDLNPHRFDWPHLYFYLNAFIYGGFGLIRALLGSIFHLPDFVYSPAIFFLLSRIVSVLLGSATIIPVYFLTKQAFGKKSAIIASIILLILPVHVYESHFAKIDVALAFFVACATYYIYQLMFKSNLKGYLVAGVWIGLATSIKYNGSLLFLPLLIAYVISCFPDKVVYKNFLNLVMPKRVVLLISAGCAAVFAFYLGSPFALIDYKNFFSYEYGVGALWQFTNLGNVSWEQYPIELHETFVKMYPDNLGFGLCVLFYLLLILFLFFNKRGRNYTFFLSTTLVFTFYISRFERSPSHYFLMLVPFYVPALGGFILEIIMWIKGKYNYKYVTLIFLALVLSHSIWLVARGDFLLSRRDTRNLAYDWVRQNLEEERDLLYVTGEDLVGIPFQEKKSEKIKKVDRSTLMYAPTPYYLIIGVKNITKESLLEGERNPDNLEGNSEPILRDADLVFYADDRLHLGPPIYIFKVNSVDFNLK